MNIEELFKLGIEKKVSDIHIIAGYFPSIRVNRELQHLTTFPILESVLSKEWLTSILTDDQRSTLELNREFDFGYNFQDHRFRVNMYYSEGGLSGSFRLIPNTILSLSELSLPENLSSLTQLKQGFILVTGPTGEGKSTTLASLINIINNEKTKHILTIEDPIEYIYPQGKSIISQREIGQDSLSWDKALKSALREDPDVVLIGEMRDFETISSALTIAETGHLVFSTVHTNSAAQTLDRIIDVFPSTQQEQVKTQLASTLKAIISQRLIPSIDTYSSLPACEILINTPAVSAIIREGKTHLIDNVIQTSSNNGMILLEQNLIDLYRNGKISKQTAIDFAIRPQEITRLIT